MIPAGRRLLILTASSSETGWPNRDSTAILCSGERSLTRCSMVLLVIVANLPRHQWGREPTLAENGRLVRIVFSLSVQRLQRGHGAIIKCANRKNNFRCTLEKRRARKE